MFDPKAAAMLILKKKGDDGGDGDIGPSGADAFRSAFELAGKGDYSAAYDAFHAAVQACMNDESAEGEGY